MDPETKRARKQMIVRPGFLCLLLILGALVACGKKGPLYLPPGMIPVVKPVPEATVKSTTELPVTPAAEDRDKTTPGDKPQP